MRRNSIIRKIIEQPTHNEDELKILTIALNASDAEDLQLKIASYRQEDQSPLSRFRDIAYDALYTSCKLELSFSSCLQQWGLTSTEFKRLQEYIRGHDIALTPKEQDIYAKYCSLKDDFTAKTGSQLFVSCDPTVQRIHEFDLFHHLELERKKSTHFLHLFQPVSYNKRGYVVNIASRIKDHNVGEDLLTNRMSIDSMEAFPYQRKLYRLAPNNSQVIPLSTLDYQFKHMSNEAGLVITKSNQFYVFNHIDENIAPSFGKILLHSIFQPGRVIFAGSIVVEKGVMTQLTNYSGHYEPKISFHTLETLDKCGVLHPGIEFHDFDGKDILESICVQVAEDECLRTALAKNPSFKAHINQLLVKVTGHGLERSSHLMQKFFELVAMDLPFPTLYAFAQWVDEWYPSPDLCTTYCDYLNKAFSTVLQKLQSQYEHLTFHIPTLRLFNSESIYKTDDFKLGIPQLIDTLSHDPSVDMALVKSLGQFAKEAFSLPVANDSDLVRNRAIELQNIKP